MRMRQSLSQLEQAFEQEAAKERHRRQMLRQVTKHRTKTRHHERAVKHQNFRYVGLVLAILATTVVVVVVMFQTLAWLMG